jgi:hypothetical protein
MRNLRLIPLLVLGTLLPRGIRDRVDRVVRHPQILFFHHQTDQDEAGNGPDSVREHTH